MRRIEIVNKKARFEFFLIENYTAGVQLKGTEVKSIREGKASLSESYCAFEGEELFIKNMNISEYSHGNIFNHEPTRSRKLLLTGKELRKIRNKVKEKGLTVVATRLFFSQRGFVKIEIAMARGKKIYDKREAIKERDLNRDFD